MPTQFHTKPPVFLKGDIEFQQFLSFKKEQFTQIKALATMSPNFLSYNESSISFSRCGVSKEAGSLYIKTYLFLFVVGKMISNF